MSIWLIKNEFGCEICFMAEVLKLKRFPSLFKETSATHKKCEKVESRVKSFKSLRFMKRQKFCFLVQRMHLWHKLIYVFESWEIHFCFFARSLLQVMCEISLKTNLFCDSPCATKAMILCWSPNRCCTASGISSWLPQFRSNSEWVQISENSNKRSH